ncbi:polysaccharide deacetylase family protein [Geopsychrobacter electrodiphilus]|uniref:polysaccharide deacetylase family protein n=1 Tax=Geopsychrobacter electrodiphilus TaxID=225196 RepID=UPI00146DD6D6|nr:polysaccharide deacetylase family protein [Geopsychrobacter electrodiphilus]
MFLLVFSAIPSPADVHVFIYHRFNESIYPSTNISTDVFAAQLAYLKKGGFQVLPLSRIAQLVVDGEPLPEKVVGLSIDDAFTSFSSQALPLLEEYGFPATLFVNTAAVGDHGYLDWSQLQDAMSHGVEIGNHTESHAYLVEMKAGETVSQWQERIRADIERSQQSLKAHLGITPDIFAYTYGEYTPAVIGLVRQLGFKAAFAQQSGVICRHSDIWTLPRFPMGGPYATLEGFISKLNMRPLKVLEISPNDPVIRLQNPPVMKLRLADPAVAQGKINCFVQGDNVCHAEKDPERINEILVRADKPLSGRRNKYTLTALGDDGRWKWFSKLWINAHRPVPAISDQP